MIISPPPVVPTPTFNPPTPSFADSHAPTNVLMTLLSREEPDCVNIFQCRTTTNIILSSLTTIFACTWVALHLRTPSTRKSWWVSSWRRFGWMIGALIAPEAMAGIAMEELLYAKEYKEMWNVNFVKLCSPELVIIPGKTTARYKGELEVKQYDSRWTLTHGFLARMGGIRFYDSSYCPQKFKPKRSDFEDPQMQSVIQQIGLISRDNITDKSKGHGITKFFVVLQTTWFIIQCLARWATHLPVTELEVVTLAYAVLNIFIYALWWHKPQSLGDPFRIFVDKDSGRVPERVEVKGTSEEEEISNMDVTAEKMMPILRHSWSATIVSKESNMSRTGGVTKLLNGLEWVETTYYSKITFIHEDFGGPEVFAVLSGTIFGALHLIPLWLSVFPSDIERKLWQVSAFYVTGAPLCTLAFLIVVALLLKFTWLPSCIQCNDPIHVILLYSSVPYAIARVILLVLTLATLRSLPTGAFQNVEWTMFIPHF